MVNNVSKKIDDVLNDYANPYESFIHKNNVVHVGYAPYSEGITKDVGISKRSDKKSNKKLKNRKVILNTKRTPYKKIPTPTKEKKTPQKKKKYVAGSKESSRKKRNVVHHKKMALEKEHFVEEPKYYEIMELLSNS